MIQKCLNIGKVYEIDKMVSSKVDVVIPVYNEEKTLEKVLDTVLICREVDKIVVVDDGSTDNTWKNLNLFKKRDTNNKVRLIRLEKNCGKGYAVKIGAKSIEKHLNAKFNYVLLIDADLVGLKEYHLQKLIDKIRYPDTAMVIGLRDKENFILNIMMKFFPLTGGERAFKKDVFFDIIKNPLIGGWGLESVMNNYCKKRRLVVKKVMLDGLNHIGLQTKKYGPGAFFKEIKEVIKTKIKLTRVRYD